MARYMKLIVLFAVLFAVDGCAKLPQTDIDAARAAFNEAEGVEAETYAESDFALAKSALAGLDVEVALQSAKSAAVRRYNTTLFLASEAKKYSEEAKAVATEARAKLEVQVTDGLKTLDREITSTERALNKALSMRRIRLEREAVEMEIDDAKTLADRARTDLSTGMLFDAQEKIVDALGKLAASQVKVSLAVKERAK